MKKQNVINLIKYFSENNDLKFVHEATHIAKYFDSIGDYEIAEYIMALINDNNAFYPQINEEDSKSFIKVEYSNEPLLLPSAIMEDVSGMINAISKNIGVNKFLFEGNPGTGKTETVKQVARILQREIYMVNFNSLIDARLGETSKNIAKIFDEINNLKNPNEVLILFDEIDAIMLDRINVNDLREMGRVTSQMLKEFDYLNKNIVLVATTNLFSNFDKAIIRRFDFVINFNRYNKEDLIDIAVDILEGFLKEVGNQTRNMRLFKKILNTMEQIPYPGDLKNLIKSAVAFSSPKNENDYLIRFFKSVFKNFNDISIIDLSNKGFTVREIEILTKVSKSQISRIIRGESSE